MKRTFMKPLLVALAAYFVLHSIADNVDAQRNRRGGRGGSGWKFVSEKYDADKNGKVSLEEYTRGEEAFKILDANGDGVLEEQDWSGQTRHRGGSGDAPAAGDVAPDFELTEIRDAEKTVKLSSFAGKQPVALLFGSCT